MRDFLIAVCDEDPKILQPQSERIQQQFSLENAVCRMDLYEDPKKLFDALDGTEYDMAFLDIDMPGISGFDLAEKISVKYPQMLIVFVTSHDELVFPTFRYHPFRFIRKPYFDQEIEECIHEAVESLNDRDRVLEIQTSDGQQFVYVSDILYLESEKNYVNIITRHGILKERDTISHKEKEWGPYGFLRVHSGFLVNQKYIYAIDQESIRLRSRKYPEVPLSRRRRDAVLRSYQVYLRK